NPSCDGGFELLDEFVPRRRFKSASSASSSAILIACAATSDASSSYDGRCGSASGTPEPCHTNQFPSIKTRRGLELNTYKGSMQISRLFSPMSRFCTIQHAERPSKDPISTACSPGFPARCPKCRRQCSSLKENQSWVYLPGALRRLRGNESTTRRSIVLCVWVVSSQPSTRRCSRSRIWVRP